MGDHGTLYQLRNRLNRTNVKDPKTDYNACDDFFILVISCHIVAATLAMLRMESVDDTPSADAIHNPHNLWMESAELRSQSWREFVKRLSTVTLTFPLLPQIAMMQQELQQTTTSNRLFISRVLRRHS